MYNEAFDNMGWKKRRPNEAFHKTVKGSDGEVVSPPLRVTVHNSPISNVFRVARASKKNVGIKKLHSARVLDEPSLESLIYDVESASEDSVRNQLGALVIRAAKLRDSGDSEYAEKAWHVIRNAFGEYATLELYKKTDHLRDQKREDWYSLCLLGRSRAQNYNNIDEMQDAATKEYNETISCFRHLSKLGK